MDQTETSQPTEQKQAGSPLPIVIILIVIAVLGIVAYQMKQGNKTTSTDTTNSMTANPTTVPVMSNATYKDGTYTAEGQYMTHAGPESIKVKVTLKNNLITDSEVTPEPADEMSRKFQGIFVENYKPMVTGKNISEVQLGKVASSSLTPMGFNNALKAIMEQAKS